MPLTRACLPPPDGRTTGFRSGAGDGDGGDGGDGGDDGLKRERVVGTGLRRNRVVLVVLVVLVVHGVRRGSAVV
jgi:hypothetical protein